MNCTGCNHAPHEPGEYRETAGSRATDGTQRVEVLWSNRAPDHVLDFGGVA